MKRHTEIAWTRPDDLTPEQLEALGAGLDGFPVVIDTGLHVYLRAELTDAVELTIDAVNLAADIAMRASRRAWGAAVDPEQIAVYPSEAGLQPGPLELVGVTDLGTMVGKSRQAVSLRVKQLPAPLGHPGGGPVWTRWAGERIAEAWSSKPGPRRVEEQPDS